MRVLVIGIGGMLGHKLWQVFDSRFDAWGTTLFEFSRLERFGIFSPERTIQRVNVTNFDSLTKTFSVVRPDIVVNAVGIIKQVPEAKDPIISLEINSLFPHRLYHLCQAVGARLIHMSTDCVFSGNKGMYTEQDQPDASDLYGQSKYLGELTQPGSLTVRTSIIGRELSTTNSLIEWFLSQRGKQIRGFSKALFTGFPTLVLAEILADIVEDHPDLTGLYHVSSDAIDKHKLLSLLRDAFEIDIEIEPADEVQIDRRLDSSKFRQETGFVPLSWPELVQKMANDPTPYDQWRK